ncbi:MAG TPA: nodulation protein nolNO, partial [Sedimenticola sp.]|nr:nodulation protein nolNO [Sedimenticola sp.]
MTERLYIGLGVTYHDPAIAIVAGDGRVLFAEATERCLQLKRGLNHPPDPAQQILTWLADYSAGRTEWVLAFNWRRRRPWYEPVSRWLGYFRPEGLIAPGYRDFSTCLEKYKLFHMLACQDASLPLGGVNLVRRVTEAFPHIKLRFRHFDHHRCHAATACFSSPFPEAACLIVDSFGERGSLAAYRYRDGRLSCLAAPKGQASLGFFYMMLTELCGFDWIAGEEWKVMGLAAYGRPDPALQALMEPMLRVEGLGLRQNLRAIVQNLPRLRQRGRQPGSDPLSVADLACTGQTLFCRWMEQLAVNLHRACGSDHL